MNIFTSNAWYHPLFTNFIGGIEVTITLSDSGVFQATRIDTLEVLFSVTSSEIKNVYDRDRYSLGVILNNDNRYMFSFTKRLNATKSILLAPFYYNWVAPLFNNPLIKERAKLIALLKQNGVTTYRDKKSLSIIIGVLLGIAGMIIFWSWVLSA